MSYYTSFSSPFGQIILVGPIKIITRVYLFSNNNRPERSINQSWTRQDDYFKDSKRQILEYFEGRRKKFDIQTQIQGTPFQKKVWLALETIPFGEICSYKEVAISIGNPKAARAVGRACSQNPIPLIIPCHRVIGSSGRLTGFAYGLEIKRKLLNLEKSASNCGNQFGT